MSSPAVAIRDHRINWIQSIPFFAFHLFAAVAVFFVPFHWSYVVWAVALYYVRMCRRSPRATTGTSRTARSRPRRVFQFVLAFSPRPRRRRACCGGRRTTGTTTASPTSRRRALAALQTASGGATWAGSSATSTTRPARRRSRTSRATPSCAG